LSSTLLSNENIIRLSVFLGGFILMALWETIATKRPQTLNRAQRWPHNLVLVGVNTLLMRLIFPIFPVGVAIWANGEGYGLLNTLSIPNDISIIIAVILLDLAIYIQHVIFHKIPVLWRLHRMHHADMEIDVTTGARFHPIEIGLSLGIKMIVIIILGAPAEAVILFEVILNGASMFNHANVAIPKTIDRALRWVLVTPDMHRIHHSDIRMETDSNFGFNLPWWDRIFGTYRVEPKHGHDGMTIGLPIFRDPKEARLDKLLTQPFRDEIQISADN